MQKISFIRSKLTRLIINIDSIGYSMTSMTVLNLNSGDYIMKKKFIACFCLCFLIGISESAFAAAGDSSQASTTAGGRVTVGETAGTQLTFDPSPSVLIAVKATTSAYAMKTANAVTDTSNGKEYGTLSSATGYAQRTKSVAAATAIVAPTSATALGGTTWTWLGGS